MLKQICKERGTILLIWLKYFSIWFSGRLLGDL